MQAKIVEILAKRFKVSEKQLITNLLCQTCEYALADNLLNHEEHKKILRLYLRQNGWYEP